MQLGAYDCRADVPQGCQGGGEQEEGALECPHLLRAFPTPVESCHGKHGTHEVRDLFTHRLFILSRPLIENLMQHNAIVDNLPIFEPIFVLRLIKCLVVWMRAKDDIHSW
jgi:hypothetical protein